MPRGRKPDGPQALSGAERQARYRARHPGTAIRRFRRTADRRSRPQRWHAAVAELVALQADYARWLDAIPDATRDGAKPGHPNCRRPDVTIVVAQTVVGRVPGCSPICWSTSMARTCRSIARP